MSELVGDYKTSASERDQLEVKEHRDFKIQKPLYELWRDLVIGGRNIEGRTKYLAQSTYESATQYRVRLWLSTYRNFAKPVQSVYHSSVWRKPPDRNLPKQVQQYEGDVDRLGTDANEFFKETGRDTSIDGICFVVCDYTKKSSDVEVKTKADMQAMQMRPYFSKITADKLINWGFDIDEYSGIEILNYVVIDESTYVDNGPFAEESKVERHKILYRNGWELWERVEDKDGKDGKSHMMLIDSGTYDLNEVPVVPFYFRKKKTLVGESSIAEIAGLCTHAYTMGNALDKALYDTAFPLQLFKGFTKEQIDEFIRSSHNGLVGGPACDSFYIEPTGQSFSDLRQAISDDSRDVKEIALRITRPVSGQIESYDSKRIDRQQLDSLLHEFSYSCEVAERNCWRLMLKWMGVDMDVDDIDVEYARDFDLEKMNAEIITIFQEMRRDGDLSRETFWKILQQGELPLPDDFDEHEELTLLEKESRQPTALAGFSGMMRKKMLNEVASAAVKDGKSKNDSDTSDTSDMQEDDK